MEKTEKTTEINQTVKGSLYKIDPRNIYVVDGFNNRIDFDLDELTESIKVNGVLNPITVIEFKQSDGSYKYRLVDGERRYRATMRAISEGVDIPRIPAIFVPNLSDEDLLLQQVVRNEGKPFNEYEYAMVCYKFKEQYGYTISQIAQKLSKNQGCIHYYLDHLNRDRRIQDLLKTNQISGSEVRRIYAAHKNKKTKVIDEEAAVQEILKARDNVQKSGKDKKITSSDLSLDTKTQSVKNSKAIEKGLKILFNYYKKYTKNYTLDVDFDITEIYDQLKEGKTIDEILSAGVQERA